MKVLFKFLILLFIPVTVVAEAPPIREKAIEIDFGNKHTRSYTFDQKRGEFTVISFNTRGRQFLMEYNSPGKVIRGSGLDHPTTSILYLPDNECLNCTINFKIEHAPGDSNIFLFTETTYSKTENKKRLELENLYRKNLGNLSSTELIKNANKIYTGFLTFGTDKDKNRACEALSYILNLNESKLLDRLQYCLQSINSSQWPAEYHTIELYYAVQLLAEDRLFESQTQLTRLIKNATRNLQETPNNNSLHLIRGIAHSTLATITSRLGNYQTAHLLINDAEQHYKKSGNSAHMVTTRANRGSNYRFQNKFSLAEEQLLSSLDLTNKIFVPENKPPAITLINLAIVRASTGRYHEALKTLDTIYHLPETTVEEINLAHANAAKARILKELGRLDESIALYETTWNMYQAVGAVSNLTTIANHLIDIYTNYGDVERARYYLNEAIKYQNGSWGADQNQRLKQAEINHKLSLGDTTSALQEIEKLEQLLVGSENHFRVGRVFSQKAEALIQDNQFERALTTAMQAKTYHKSANDNLYLVRSSYLAGLAAFNQNEPIDNIFQHLNESITTIESIRENLNLPSIRQDYFALQKKIYETSAEVQLALNKSDGHTKSLYLAESFRARTLYESLFTSKKENNRLSTPTSQPSEESKLELPKLAEEAFIHYKSSIPNNKAVLYFFTGNTASYLWLATSNNLDVITLPSSDKLNEILAETIKKIEKRPSNGNTNFSWKQTYNALASTSRLLLDPIQDQLKNVDSLTIIPDGIFHRVPFSVLLDPNSNYKKPLAAAKTIRYASSIATDITLSQTSSIKNNHSMLMVANPSILDNSKGLKNSLSVSVGNLFSAQKEADNIGRLWQNYGTILSLENHQANKQKLLNSLNGNYDVIHFATHAVVDWDNPQQSAIKLSNSGVNNSEDYRNPDITLSEISELSLNTQLVVLSACETAVGKHIIGEGPIGLSRAFFEAGSKRVLASLWPVDDAATAELLSHFYQGLIRGAPPAEALRQAQVTMLTNPEFFHPYFWAGFIFIGNANNWLNI